MGRNIGHEILISQNVEHCDGTDTLYVETQHEHSNELLCNEAGAHSHVLNSAHRWTFVAKKRDPLLCKADADLLHCEPKNHKAIKFQVQVGDCPLWF
jgi:hypothetical protein